MIYDKQKPKFDDTIIRAVDLLVNATYYGNGGEYNTNPNMTDEIFEREYKTLFLGLPRQCGKSLYLTKLLKHFQNDLMLKTYLIYPKLEMLKYTDRYYKNDKAKFTINQIHDMSNPAWCPGATSEPDVMLYDEVDPAKYDEKMVRGKKFTLALYT